MKASLAYFLQIEDLFLYLQLGVFASLLVEVEPRFEMP
jgi:hypothetical protein